MNFGPLLLLPVVGGYAFATIWKASLYHASRESGHRLYFRAMFYAAFLVVCASLLHVIFFDAASYRNTLLFVSEIDGLDSGQAIWDRASIHTILCFSFVLGPVLGYLLNLPNRLPYWNRILLLSAIKNNDFELLLAHSVFNHIPIMFTLDNRKIYVGWVVRAPNPIESRKAIRILPILSGYRDADTLTAEFTTDYISALETIQGDVDGELSHLSNTDFETVIPIDTVLFAHPFDLSAYDLFERVQTDDLE